MPRAQKGVVINVFHELIFCVRAAWNQVEVKQQRLVQAAIRKPAAFNK